MTKNNTKKTHSGPKAVQKKASKPAKSPKASSSQALKASPASAKVTKASKPQKPAKIAKVAPKEIPVPGFIYKGHIQCLKTSKHFGFAPFEIHVDKQDSSKTKILKDKNFKSEQTGQLVFDNFLDEKIAIMRHYIEKKMQDLGQPPAICFSGPLKGNPYADKTREHIFNIDIIGNGKSIADAVVIETSYVILKEHHPDMELMVEINSVGDKDSFSKFTKEFASYFKKHLNELPADLRAAFKKDPMLLAISNDERLNDFAEECPKPINYLSEESRTHFREVLEYLESLGLPYMINNSLIGSRNCSTGTVFQIIGITETAGKNGEAKEKQTTLAIGERYNSISRKVFGKKEIAAIGAHILVDDKDAKKSDNIMIEEKINFYFIHLGYEAKLKSLSIIEMLRVAKIPVHQALSKDKITAQLQAAENMQVPYILLVGQREALENSVSVRHVETRVQETIHIDKLVEHLKKLC